MPIDSHAKNRLLARLHRDDYQRLAARARLVNLDFKQTLYKYRAPIDYVYFPISGAASALTVMDDGSAIEVATVGKEGVVGHTTLFAGKASPHETIVQVAGAALRIDTCCLEEEAERKSPLANLLLRYNMAFLTHISRSVACNGLHPIQQRCCRWLLITLDRMESDVVPLTHEFLGIMLGVRRVSVTEVLRSLQDKGLVKTTRGKITILNRQGMEQLACECYRKSREEFQQMLG